MLKVPFSKKIEEKKIKSLTKLLITLSSENSRNDPELAWLDPILAENVEDISGDEGEVFEDGDDSE